MQRCPGDARKVTKVTPTYSRQQRYTTSTFPFEQYGYWKHNQTAFTCADYSTDQLCHSADEKGDTCSMHEENMISIQNFIQKIRRQDTSSKMGR